MSHLSLLNFISFVLKLFNILLLVHFILLLLLTSSSLPSLNLRTAVLWDVTPCSMVETFKVPILKTKVLRLSDRQIHYYQSIQCHITEATRLQSPLHLKFYFNFLMLSLPSTFIPVDHILLALIHSFLLLVLKFRHSHASTPELLPTLQSSSVP
jgi:hypothetical protein